MSTVIEHLGGVGINGYYRVVRDGKMVATIERNANRGWRLLSVHYREHLRSARDVDAVRSIASSFEHYPTADEVYEAIANRVEDMRRRWKTTSVAQYMGALARDMANGSNGAQDRLIEIAREIEAFATDRTDTGNHQWLDGMRWPAVTEGHAYLGDSPNYPKPPQAEEKAA